MFGLSNRKLFLYCLLYFLTTFALAMGGSQYVTYLAEVGYSVAERGMIVAAYSTLLIFLQVFLGNIVDKTKKIKLIFGICLFVFAITLAGLFQIQTKVYVLQLVLILISGSLMSSNLNLIDNLLLSYGKREVEAYSFIRSFGSFGWALSCLVVGPIVMRFTYSGLGIAAFVIGIMACAVLLLLPEPTVADKEQMKVTMVDVLTLLKDRNYIIVIIALFLLSVTSNSVGTIVTDKMLEQGATPQDISLRWSISAFAEIPIYIIGAKIISRFGHYRILIAGAVALIIQFILYMTAGSISIVLIASALQMFTGPFMMLPGRLLVNEYAPDNLKATALMVATSIYAGVPTIIVPLFGGMITTRFGANITLAVAIGFAVLGLLVSYLLYGMNKVQKIEA